MEQSLEENPSIPYTSEREQPAIPSASEDIDTDSQPSASASDRAGTSQEDWPEVDDTRYDNAAPFVLASQSRFLMPIVATDPGNIGPYQRPLLVEAERILRMDHAYLSAP